MLFRSPRRVEAFGDRDEVDPERPEFVEPGDQVPHRSREPRDLPNEHHVDAASAHARHQLIEARAAILRAGHAVVDVLTGDAPAAMRDEGAQLRESARLFERTCA